VLRFKPHDKLLSDIVSGSFIDLILLIKSHLRVFFPRFLIYLCGERESRFFVFSRRVDNCKFQVRRVENLQKNHSVSFFDSKLSGILIIFNFLEIESSLT
jgi:hypothetical protein